MKTQAYRFQDFMTGNLDQKKVNQGVQLFAFAAVPAAAPVGIEHAFDPVVQMLQHMAFPVATIVLAWACLQAMIGKPAEATDKAKWAVLGYLAMKYIPGLLAAL